MQVGSFAHSFQDPSGGKPMVTEYTLLQADCRKRLLQFKSPKGGLTFVPNEVYTAEVVVFENSNKDKQLTRVLQLFSRKERTEEPAE